MPKTIYVFEDMEHLPRRTLFRFLGVQWVGTPYWWISPLWLFILGIVIAYWTLDSTHTPNILLDGIAYALLMMLSIVWHSIGHLIGGKLAGHPMTGNLVTATLPVNLYDGKKYPSRVHFIRSAGGPILNLSTGVALLALDRFVFSNHFLTFTAYVNLVFFVAALAPLPTMDGGVFVRELRNWRKQ
jgi:Zn-dependent protease